MSDQPGIMLHETTSGRHWELRPGDLIVTTQGIYLGSSNSIRNGTTGNVLRDYDDGRVRLRPTTEDRLEVTVQLHEYAFEQPVALHARRRDERSWICFGGPGALDELTAPPHRTG